MTPDTPVRQPPPAAGEPLDAWPGADAGAAVGAIVDIDGTLVDTSYHHTVAWGRAFSDHGVDVALWQVHRHNGMGGDQLVAAVAGDHVEKRLGDGIRTSEAERYAELIDEIRPLAGARELLIRLKERGHRVVLASSAKLDEVEHYVELLDARDIVDAWTSSGDVERTKPHPDLITTAADRLQPSAHAVVIGDTAWDAVAAGKAGLPSIGLLTGGFGAAELRDAGCCAVYTDAAELAASLDEAFAAAAQSARRT